MRNPFQQEPLPPESEADAGALFSELTNERLSQPASASIKGGMLAALDATRSAVGHSGRFAFAAPAVLLPLLAIGAVGAATGDSPLSAPGAVLESAATSLGIVSPDAPAPEANDPGTLVRAQEAPTTNLPAGDTPLPSAQLANGEEGDDGDNTGEPAASSAALAAHTDGNGCDDVLFANGEPPFATPGGPVGCEVGNSADHRQNGVNHEDDGEETPDEGDTGDEGDEDGEESSGGVSRGLGRGHVEDRPGNGNGFGHEKHEHDPNPNGHGPGGPNADDDEGDGDTGGEDGSTSAPSSTDTTGDATSAGPGNSGNAPGRQNNPAKNN